MYPIISTDIQEDLPGFSFHEKLEKHNKDS